MKCDFCNVTGSPVTTAQSGDECWSVCPACHDDISDFWNERLDEYINGSGVCSRHSEKSQTATELDILRRKVHNFSLR